ncbi:3-phosphoshikimate 1-carboxyvinyltransferase [Galbibacter marinus]|uniref:3-phosphoshikimate 1-carboxyvinyltransferase n=1 Tax=Galbibacter marinus TaxID=555500 RepID=K2QI52_9FLAO|nr:3-phosphoshikimate 1-carboxyvinyltransferase [Galbibacter marinus]EKF54397.1 3-phosphoshikimate 1-carboxyvinyltransferase [Galbibacter marinus]
MNIRIQSNQTKFQKQITITGSKSESNRCLLLRALYPGLTIENLSNSDDSVVMEKGLEITSGTVDIHHAGTAMRFLTAFFAVKPGAEIILTGSKRMTERPIEILVDALRQLGAEISYENNQGYPPIKIKGKQIIQNKVTLAANISSQYISALLLVAPSLENGLILQLEGKITSVPYIRMTLSLLEELGVQTNFEANTITVKPLDDLPMQQLVVESDWSSASYYYSIVALCEVGTTITLSSYKQNSLQGDSVLQEIYKEFGVESSFKGHDLLLSKVKDVSKDTVINLDLSNAPDIAQTIAVSCFGLSIGCELKGLHTLKIKETDRLEALKAELGKLGADISVTDKTLSLKATSEIKPEVAIDTYDDHRMAMAFAPLALKVPILINDAEVVSKSYPDFWKDLNSLGFQIEDL